MMIANQRIASDALAHDVVGEPVVDPQGRYMGAIAGVFYDPRLGFTALRVEGGGGQALTLVVDEGIRYGPSGWQLTQRTAPEPEPWPAPLAEAEGAADDYLLGRTAAVTLRGPRGEILVREGERVSAGHVRILARTGRLEALQVR